MVHLVTTPKTRSSVRTIPISEILVKDLKVLKERQEKIYGFKESWFILGSFEPISPDRIRLRKNKNCELAKVKQIRIHDFRHSCASLLISKGANITLVAKYLGHTKIDETLNTYSHFLSSSRLNFSGKRSSACSVIPGSETYLSRHPLLPQTHGRPSFMIGVCPISPAVFIPP